MMDCPRCKFDTWTFDDGRCVICGMTRDDPSPRVYSEPSGIWGPAYSIPAEAAHRFADAVSTAAYGLADSPSEMNRSHIYRAVLWVLSNPENYAPEKGLE